MAYGREEDADAMKQRRKSKIIEVNDENEEEDGDYKVL